MSLQDKKCVPCEAGTPPLSEGRVRELLGEVEGWSHRDNKIRKDLKFADFVSAMEFVNGLAEVAEREEHGDRGADADFGAARTLGLEIRVAKKKR